MPVTKIEPLPFHRRHAQDERELNFPFQRRELIGLWLLALDRVARFPIGIVNRFKTPIRLATMRATGCSNNSVAISSIWCPASRSSNICRCKRIHLAHQEINFIHQGRCLSRIGCQVFHVAGDARSALQMLLRSDVSTGCAVPFQLFG